jgi:nitronate monooxygenase
MRLIALAPLAFEVSKAGGLGFLGAGSDVSTLSSMLEEVKNLSASEPTLRDLRNDVLPIGVGFLLWAGRELLEIGLPALEKYPPAAVWFFAPNSNDDLVHWTKEIRRVTANKTRIWIQVPSVSHAVSATRLCAPDVLVIQGQDAGGHGLHCGAGLLPLFPEAEDAVTAVCATEKIPNPVFVAAGGILEARTAAAALALGASGIAMGTRYLLTPEANIAQGYREVSRPSQKASPLPVSDIGWFYA